MKKINFIITLMLLFIATSVNAQMHHAFDYSEFEKVDSLPIELAYFYSHIPVKGEGVIDLDEGFYMKPFKATFVIKTNADKTKAIVEIDPPFLHRVYNVIESERRITLWYKDKDTYCGYVYDKELKACQNYGTRKERKNFVRRSDRFFRRHPMFFKRKR